VVAEPAITGRLADWAGRVERALELALPAADDEPARLHSAMRYSSLGGGKRIRPALVYATGELLGIDPSALDAAAAAIEMIHVYSLVHDDLPAMDDDEYRRGRLTCHRQFDEATAILAGDALQVLAFSTLAASGAPPDRRLAMIALLARASGTRGMAGGQAIDLAAAGRVLSVGALEHMHRLKTGELLKAAVLLPAVLADLVPEALARLDRFGADLGLAFQIVDDLLDVTGDPKLLGKATGADQARGKPTYPALVGVEAARTRAAALHASAAAELAPFGPPAASLLALADFLTRRVS
jgi:geranylgeranyl pyrophosphate synthase